MALSFDWSADIELHVADRIQKHEAERQTATAKEILKRFVKQPGLILADEVGMGKTFVAFAVATSTYLSNNRKRPIVLMVPGNLKAKWIRDFSFFKQKCLSPDVGKLLTIGAAGNSLEFLQMLDSGEHSLIVLPYGALKKALNEEWVRLAIIWKAVKNNNELRDDVAKHIKTLISSRETAAIAHILLKKDPSKWIEVARKHHIHIEGNPLPKAFLEKLYGLNTRHIYQILQDIPIRNTEKLGENLQKLRTQLSTEIQILWKSTFPELRIKVPLVILDEAHHLKNAHTRLSSFFQESKDEAENITKGELAGVFERMLLMTATPFQLGHYELVSVLERFDGITWSGKNAPVMKREEYKERIAKTKLLLDAAQKQSLILDSQWGLLKNEDLRVGDRPFEDVEEWWKVLREPQLLKDNLSERTRLVLEAVNRSKIALQEAEKSLKPWVIRHIKPKDIDGRLRRENKSGSHILMLESQQNDKGLPIEESSLLPFFLAARAVACSPDTRPVFAEGLASSYQAFLNTRKNRQDMKKVLDTDDTVEDEPVTEENIDFAWYVDRIAESVPAGDSKSALQHPKVKATIERALAIWRTGEKVLIFCHYIETGRALRQLISEQIQKEIHHLAKINLGIKGDIEKKLKNEGDRFNSKNSPLTRQLNDEMDLMLGQFPGLSEHSETIKEVVKRILRTPSILVRFFPAFPKKITNEPIIKDAFAKMDGSGLSLREILNMFFIFLQNRCGSEERLNYLEAIKKIQVGTHSVEDINNSFDPDEKKQAGKGLLLPNVRLVNGGTGTETRQRLMLTFNTPFYPEILIASSVMAEGVDLHLNCRHIIHHDLCWNPSTLEQRTGRVDRIGAKVEHCNHSIEVYLPYVGETQDEKMYRVVMDRERWFKVVMGEKFKVDARNIEEHAKRIPLPKLAAEELTLSLEVWKR